MYMSKNYFRFLTFNFTSFDFTGPGESKDSITLATLTLLLL